MLQTLKIKKFPSLIHFFFSFRQNQSEKKDIGVHKESLERSKRAATARPERIWDYAVIPYEIDANFSGNHKALFKQVRINLD